MNLLPKSLLEALKETGLPWDLAPGSKHYKLRVNGAFIGIWPLNGKSDADPRATKNTISQIRRYAAGVPVNLRQQRN